MMKFAVLDNETLRCTDPRLCNYLAENVKPDSRLKDPAKIEADIAEKREAVISKSGLDGGFGMLAVIGVGIVHLDFNDPITEVIQYCNTEGTLAGERKLLEDFWRNVSIFSITDPQGNPTAGWMDIVGHNIKWDLRFIIQRTIVHGLGGIALPEIFDINTRYSHRVHDTMEMWAGWGERISLDRLCTILGIESPKKEMDGSQVHDAWMAGDQEREMVKAYNVGDIKAAMGCYIRMREAGL